MQSKSNQRGSAVQIVIVIVLMFAVIGLLGYVFWQNFEKSKQDNRSTISQPQTDVNLSSKQKETAATKAGNLTTSDTRVNFQYPTSWTEMEVSGEQASDSETIRLVAPDGFTVYMTISRLIRGWTEGDLTLTVLDVQSRKGTDVSWVVVDALGMNPISLQLQGGQDLPAVGSKKLNGSLIAKIKTADNGAGVYLEAYGQYDQTMSLDEFTAKESVQQAKALIESIKLGI